MNTTGKFSVHLTIPDEIIEIDQIHFPQPWTSVQWHDLDLKQNHLFSWNKENKLIGYALFQYLSDDDTAHLLKILILPEFRGSGETQAFWLSIAHHLRGQSLKSIYLEVEATNTRAISFYKRTGFELLRKNKAYYSNGDDALIMSMTL